MIDRPLWQLLLELNKTGRNGRPFSCTECFSVLEYLAEAIDKDLTPGRQAALQKAVRNHLAACPDCRTHYQARLEELETLLKAQADEKKYSDQLEND